MGQGPVGQSRGVLIDLPNRLDRTLAVFGALLLACLMADVLLGVITRALGDPLDWTDEGARFLMVWRASTGWMIATRKRAHVRIRFFQNLLPAAAWGLVERAIQAALVLLGAIIAAFAVGLVVRNADLDATSLPLSMAWIYVPLIPAGALMAVQAAMQAFRPGEKSGA